MADVSFVLELVDKLSSTADKMSASLKKVEAGTQKAGKETDSFFGRVSSANKRVQDEFLEGVAEKFAVFELAKGAAELVGELAEKVGDVAIEFGKSTVEAGLFEQKTSLAFEALTGSASKGGAVLEEVKGFANKFGESYSKVADMFQTGLLGGIKFEGKQSITELAQAALDIEKATRGKRSAAGIMDTFADIKSGGDLAGRSLIQFKGLLDFKDLASKFHTTEANLREVYKAATPDQRIQALVSTIGDKFGVVGALAEKNAKLIDGQWQILHNRWDDLLGRVEKSGALEAAGHIIEKIGQSLEGKHWSDTFDKLFASVTKFLAPLATDEGLKKFEDGLYRIANGVEKFTSKVTQALPALDKIFGFISKLDNMNEDLKGALSLEGWTNPGVMKSEPKQLGPGSELAGGLHAFAEGGYVDRPTAGIFGEAGGEYLIPERKMAAMGSRTVNAPISQVIHVHGAGGGSAEETGRVVHRLGLSDLQGSIDTLAQQLGSD